jgi:beta-galactosidase
MPSAWFDEEGRLLPTGKGSAFEQLFGATLDDFQFSSNRKRTLVTPEGKSLELEGFVADITPTTGKDIACFASEGTAIVEHRLGKGTAVLIAASLSLMCRKPGHPGVETLLATLAHPISEPLIRSDAIVYRLAAPTADHYFLINDREARTVSFKSSYADYRFAIDVLTGEKLVLGDPVHLEAHSGRWLRLEKG